MPPAIRIENLGKCYRRPTSADGAAPYATLREQLSNWSRRLLSPFRHGAVKRPRAEDFWALKDVSFAVQAGDTVGIIGRNGAGKSTLLKILAQITKPTSGCARLRGRVGSLLEVGTGFHPELTGRENIYLNGSILGMSRREISRRFDEIVAFAEVSPFLETPVKHYSSGMYTRLAFAVAAHLEPEILIIDEVLAVGDIEFQKKCMKKMGDVAGDGRTVLFVSHNMGAVQSVCRQAVLLASGQIQKMGPSRDVVAEYLKCSNEVSAIAVDRRTDRTGEGRFRFEEVVILDAEGRARPYAVTGEDLYLQLRLRVPDNGPLPAPLEIGIGIHEPQGLRITEVGSHFVGQSPTTGAAAREVVCYMPRLPLLPAQYRLDLWCGVMGETEDYLRDAATLRVEPGNYFANCQDARLPATDKNGYCVIPQRWDVRPPRRPTGGKA
jgi:lipopolysaccharide transport system ATP-binding protein